MSRVEMKFAKTIYIYILVQAMMDESPSTSFLTSITWSFSGGNNIYHQLLPPENDHVIDVKKLVLGDSSIIACTN
jgi:hypothetical protein